MLNSLTRQILDQWRPSEILRFMTDVVNPFAGADGAARYAAGRPFFHPLLLSHLLPELPGREVGADVACGTGLSSLALAEVVGTVLAFDTSAEMLGHAPAHPRIRYAQAAAESLPVPDHTLDTLTVAQAFHWFQRNPFLAEARRTLKPGSVLFLYDDFFTGQMTDAPEFAAFMKEYGTRYPTPPRHREPFGEAEAQAAGFSFREASFAHPWTFTLDELVRYLLTHSNTIAATDSGKTTTQEVRDWLTAQLRPFFPAGGGREVWFRGWYAVLKSH